MQNHIHVFTLFRIKCIYIIYNNSFNWNSFYIVIILYKSTSFDMMLQIPTVLLQSGSALLQRRLYLAGVNAFWRETAFKNAL